MSDLILNEYGAAAHPHLQSMKLALYEAMKAMKPKDLNKADFELFIILENEFEV
ncbi:MAG: hypothetical protein ABI605_16685 [Rhizobacter sp.]